MHGRTDFTLGSCEYRLKTRAIHHQRAAVTAPGISLTLFSEEDKHRSFRLLENGALEGDVVHRPPDERQPNQNATPGSDADVVEVRPSVAQRVEHLRTVKRRMLDVQGKGRGGGGREGYHILGCTAGVCPRKKGIILDLRQSDDFATIVSARSENASTVLFASVGSRPGMFGEGRGNSILGEGLRMIGYACLGS